MIDEHAAIISSKVMSNCLIRDNRYYVEHRKLGNYLLCLIESPSGVLVKVHIKDMNVLRGDNWFNTDIMTLIGYVLLQSDVKKVCIIYHDNIGTQAIRDGK